MGTTIGTAVAQLTNTAANSMLSSKFIGFKENKTCHIGGFIVKFNLNLEICQINAYFHQVVHKNDPSQEYGNCKNINDNEYQQNIDIF